MKGGGKWELVRAQAAPQSWRETGERKRGEAVVAWSSGSSLGSYRLPLEGSRSPRKVLSRRREAGVVQRGSELDESVGETGRPIGKSYVNGDPLTSYGGVQTWVGAAKMESKTT